ncbi:MAG TPA: hypothetical protein VJ648_05395 [Vicinamibacteria bacterium]|nr:hypothetical protein [Vicinamibacteria bacterium]
MPLQPGDRLGPYAIQSLLGEGGMGEVHRSATCRVAGGLAFIAGPVDLFASYTKYVWGRDAHNGQVFGAGVSWYFGLPE